LAGGISYLILTQFNVPKDINFIISASVIVVIRLIAVKFELQLPKINDDLFGKS
ncbi:MAG: trimeric intracellular cation channel family protein, partial [Flavobacteriales bacterium]